MTILNKIYGLVGVSTAPSAWAYIEGLGLDSDEGMQGAVSSIKIEPNDCRNYVLKLKRGVEWYNLTQSSPDLSLLLDGNGAIYNWNNSIEAFELIPPGDTTPPVMTLNGPDVVTVELPASYMEEGVAAYDAFDGGYVSVNYSGTVGTAPGDYTLTYTATDIAGNTSTLTRIVQVYQVDTTPPDLSLNGEAAVSLAAGEAYQELGAFAYDAFDGGYVSVNYSGTVGTAPGDYTLTYTALDIAGNTSTLTRIVQVYQHVPGTYNIKSVDSGKCLDVAYASHENGGNIYQWDCHGGNNQKWELVPDGPNFQIKSVDSGKCLDVDASQENGDNIYQWDCGRINQMWEVSTEDGTAFVRE